MNPYRITSLHLTQVGPFKELELILPATPENGKAEVHILTGENGAGKTSILEVISTKFSGSYFSGSLNELHGKARDPSTYEIMSRLHRLGSSTKVNFTVDKNSKLVKDSEYIPSNEVLGVKSRRLSVLDFKNTNYPIVLKPRFAAFAYSGYRRSESNTIPGGKEIGESPLANATDLTRSIDSKIFLQWLVNTQTREFIARGKNKPKEAEKHRQNLSIVENAITDVTSLKTFFELEDNPFQAKINVDGQSLDFDQIPDGLKSIVSWLGDLLMRMDRIQWADEIPVLERPFLLLLDEIDVHLHPAWQRKILPVVQKLFPNAQVIVSTHSPFVVGSVDGAWVHKFVKKDGFSVLDGPPILSEDARSYEYILEEIFGIKERFGIQVETDLSEFQQLKKQALTNDTKFNELRFQELIQSLSSQSIELESMIGMELKQLQRLTQRSFV